MRFFTKHYLPASILVVSLAFVCGCNRNEPAVIPAASHGAEATAGKETVPGESGKGTQDAAKFEKLERATNPSPAAPR